MLCNDRAHATTYSTAADRRRGLPAWLHYYNHLRSNGPLDRATLRSFIHALSNASDTYT